MEYHILKALIDDACTKASFDEKFQLARIKLMQKNIPYNEIGEDWVLMNKIGWYMIIAENDDDYYEDAFSLSDHLFLERCQK